MSKRKVSEVSKVAATCAEAKLISVPDEVIATFAQNRSVWEGLYKWLVKEHGAVDGGQSGLHNRTFAGKQLMDRLLRADRQRIRRDNPRATKGEVNRAANWNDANAGPQGIFEGQNLEGDALFFLPPGVRRGVDLVA